MTEPETFTVLLAKPGRDPGGHEWTARDLRGAPALLEGAAVRLWPRGGEPAESHAVGLLRRPRFGSYRVPRTRVLSEGLVVELETVNTAAVELLRDSRDRLVCVAITGRPRPTEALPGATPDVEGNVGHLECFVAKRVRTP